jgi:RNA polymerase sigma-70 factor (ECF subfamily)
MASINDSDWKAPLSPVDVNAAPDLGDIGSLYQAHGARIWRAVYAYAGERSVADEAVAEAFAQCIARGAAVDNPLAWIWRASFRIAAGELKDRRVSWPPRELSYEMVTEDPDLTAALKLLPDRQRAVVVLHYYVGYPATQIAEALGTSSATVRVQLMHARRKLRTLLGDSDD